MELVSFEKMVLTEGMTDGGRNPATTIAMVAASRAYSIKSCPRRSFTKSSSNPRMIFLRLTGSILNQMRVTNN